MIGFHAIYNKDTQGESGAANAVLGYYLTRWGLDERGIACVTIMPPTEMGWLTGPDGKGCGIAWKVLTPERDVPLVLPLPPPPPPPPPVKERRIVLKCSPVSITDLPDPVIDIAVEVIWQKGGNHWKITSFDAWHFTANGKVYKRSEQYVDRRFSDNQVGSLWEGSWIRDRTIYMVGQVTKTHGVYDYKEFRFYGKPGPQNWGDEVTSSVCAEVRQ